MNTTVSKAQLSLQHRKTGQLIKHLWPSDEGYYISKTMDTEEAARWCYDCIEEAVNSLPPEMKRDYKPVVNLPPNNPAWIYVCRDCEQESIS